jgi:hypothetical protein
MAKKKKEVATAEKWGAVIKKRTIQIPLDASIPDGEQITVKRTVGLDDSISYISFVVQAAFSDEDEYAPSIVDFASRVATLMYFTDLELPDETGLLYDISYSSDIYERVHRELDFEQISALETAIYQTIDKELDNQKYGSLGAVTDSLAKLFKTVSEATSGLDLSTLADLLKTAGDTVVPFEPKK